MTIGGKKISLTTQIFVAMIIGSIAGLICGDIMKQVAFISEEFKFFRKNCWSHYSLLCADNTCSNCHWSCSHGNYPSRRNC